MNKRFLVIDATNILYRTFYANKKEDEDEIIGLAHHVALMTLNKYFKKFKPHKIVLCFDRHSWRKDYTADEELCVSGVLYKGNRRTKMTPSEKEKFQRFIEHVSEFEEMMRKHTSIICLAADGCEADDMIAGFVQATADEGNEFVILSGDKDLIQLLRYPGTTLIDPSTGKQRTLDEWGGDPNLFIYEKCIRGDRGDNVVSARPRIRKNKILQSYNDNFAHANLMEETFTIGEKEFTVKDLFKENALLMDLTQQPTCIQRKMVIEILKETENPGKYSHFHFVKFLSANQLDKIKQQAELFALMLSR